MLENKKFQNNETQEVVYVTGDSGVFYSLSNGANIKKDIFFQKFSECVDPTSFFQQQSAVAMSGLAEKFKQVDTSKVQDIGGNRPPEVKYIQESVSEQLSAPPEYKDMMMRRFQEEQARRDLSQYKVYDNDDEAAAEFERKQKEAERQRQHPVKSLRHQQEEQIRNEGYTTRNEYPDATGVPGNIPQSPPPQMTYTNAEEEAWRFFKSFKRIYPIKLTIDFDEKIAEPDFLKMMANNFEADIINFYTKQIMDRVYNDPGFLENKIYEKLRSIVYDEPQRKIKTARIPKTVTDTKKITKKRVSPVVPKENKEKLQEGK